jgi:hypothetical protein
MGCTVFAEGMGWFHQSSNGTGTAPGDVCLSPPPSPAGPVPVPYVNQLFASDLTKGSKSVTADGSPTALENSSEIAMSTGNEPATPGLGAGVVTHKIKGKGSFSLWSFTVKVEGKGVCRHGDPLLQNEACTPPNCTAPGAKVLLKGKLAALGVKMGKKKCDVPYSQDCRPDRTAAQRDAVNGKPCWECKGKKATGTAPFHRDGTSKMQETKMADGTWKDKEYRTHDHQPPLNRAWELGGCHLQPSPDAFKKLMGEADMVRPHCEKHYMAQGSKVKAHAKAARGT